MVLGFELAMADPRFVGLNMVMPEDYYVPMHDFPLHMRMMQYLHGQYPKVHVTLHAGELVEGLVPPEDLRFHVRDSVEMAGAERIGHGVDTLNETNALELLSEMAKKNVMVEICLTSNDVILGVRGNNHPLHDFMQAGVPVALATDDEGVSRSDMTHEYLQGSAKTRDLSYSELKRMARTSLEHAFITGASLWSDGKTFAPVKECAGVQPGAAPPRRPARSFWTAATRRACNGNWNSSSANSRPGNGRRLQLKALGQQRADGRLSALTFELVNHDGIRAKFQE